MFNWIFSESEKELVLSLLAKGRKEQEKNIKFSLIYFDSFYKLFSEKEIEIIKKYLAIDPQKIGYKLPYLGLEKIPDDIVQIANQSYPFDGKTNLIPCQYLPKEAFEAYLKLNDAIQKEINRKLLVLYGYRSPARQVFMFFDILQRIYDFDFNKTIKRVCLPEYSEHVCPSKQAIDFVTADGVKGEGFEKTEEYIWLQKNAKHFGFTESYFKNNDLDMMYEPWHWRYESKKL